MITATRPSASPLTNTIQPIPKTKKTHTPPTDRQMPLVILNNNTNKKKKKKKTKTSVPTENKNKNDPRDKTTDRYCGRGQPISTTRTEQS